MNQFEHELARAKRDEDTRHPVVCRSCATKHSMSACPNCGGRLSFAVIRPFTPHYKLIGEKS